MNRFILRPLLLISLLFVFSNSLAGKDKLNAIIAKVSKNLHQLEMMNHVEIGLSAIETFNNTHINFNANKRFPMDSTSKLMVISAILKKSENNRTLLMKRIFFTASDVTKSGYAPITSKYIKRGMTVSELCRAALEYSDNAAVNQLIKILGGPGTMTKFARSIGDKKYFLVRWEPYLNSAIPHDKRDTTTPFAMADSVQTLVLGNALNGFQRNLLQNWMKHCKTGDQRIRAGVPNSFIVADKTGTGGYGSIGDIGVVWRKQASPIVLVIYARKFDKNAHTSDKVIAKATQIVISAMSMLR